MRPLDAAADLLAGHSWLGERPAAILQMAGLTGRREPRLRARAARNPSKSEHLVARARTSLLGTKRRADVNSVEAGGRKLAGEPELPLAA